MNAYKYTYTHTIIYFIYIIFGHFQIINKILFSIHFEFIESRSHIAPKPTPRNSKLVASDSNQLDATVSANEIEPENETSVPVDRSSGDYSEAKKFWQSLECDQKPQQMPPVPKPRSQSQTFASLPLTIDDHDFGQFSITDDNISQSSSKISSEAQVEKSESYSSHIEVKSSAALDDDSCLENESFPQLSERCDTDSLDLKQHQDADTYDESDYFVEKSESLKYKITEREDILDDDDCEDSDSKKGAASFYIGEKSGNIITKSITDKQTDADADELEEESSQGGQFNADEIIEDSSHEEIQREVHFNLEPEEIKISYECVSGEVIDSLDYEHDIDSIHSGSVEEKSDSESLEKVKPDEPQHVNKSGDDVTYISTTLADRQIPANQYEIENESLIEADEKCNVSVEQLEQNEPTFSIVDHQSAVIPSQVESDNVSLEKSTSDVIGWDEIVEAHQNVERTVLYEADETIAAEAAAETRLQSADIPLESVNRPLVLHSPIETFGGVEPEAVNLFPVESEQTSELLVEHKMHSPQTAPVKHSPIEPVKNYVFETESQSEDSSTKEQPEDNTIDRLNVVHRKDVSKASPKTRWSATDQDHSSAGSHNDSEASRPCSSDVENLYVSFPNSSAEYQTALDASYIPGSTEYHTAASTFDHSGKTISSQDSMKSFSESSGNLGSVEVSEASETLVASVAEDILSDTQDLQMDESEQRLSSLDTFGEAALDDLDDAELDGRMKRSHEMIFSDDISSGKQQESVPVLVEKAESIERRIMEDDIQSDVRAQNEFGTSLGDNVSYLSMSLSSNTSNVDTIVENIPDDLAGSLNSCTMGSYESRPFTRDDVTSTSFEEQTTIETLIMTTSTVQEGDITSVNTQITTEAAGGRSKGHRRNDSQTFMGNLEMSKLSQESSDSSLLDDEMVVHDVPDESDESDYDRYETEYSRSFKTPTDRQRKKNTMAAQRPEGELERKKSIPSIETIVEDAEEIEMEKMRGRAEASQNMLDYSNIPDIMITDDPTKYVSSDDDYEPEMEKQATGDVVKQTGSAPKHKEDAPIEKISNEQYEQLIEQQYKTQIEKELKSDSPDSFEMVEDEQHDISDEFVIIEEVAKEAHELMSEGQSVSIKSTSYAQRAEEIDKMLVKSAPAATNEGSTLLHGRHDLAFEFEDSPPSGAGTESSEDGGNGMESSRKWVEMQLAEQAQNLRYPYDVDRGILEDIKEEDTDFDVGSSRISSFKDSYSSNDFESAAARRYKPKEQDNISMNSLQEFESLEQAISLENRRFCSSSHDSLSNGSFPKAGFRTIQADEISLASLKDFEGLENACLEATLLEIKAKEEHALLLSRSDESTNSGKSDENKIPAKEVVIVTSAEIRNTVTEFPQHVVSGGDVNPHKIDESIDGPYLMEISTDSLDGGSKHTHQMLHGKNMSRHGSTDSLEISKSGDAMTSSVDSIEMSKGGTTAKSDCDSIEQMAHGEKRDSIDSIDAQYIAMTQSSQMQRDSFDANTLIDLTSSVTMSGSHTLESRTITTSMASSSGYGGGISKDISSDSLNLAHSEPELLITSTESLDHTSSTFATYYNETDSQMTMSGSMTSCDSNTLIDNMDTVVRAESYHTWDDCDATANLLLCDIEIDEQFGARMTSPITPTSAHNTTSGHSDVNNS